MSLKVKEIDTLVLDGIWRNWVFVRVTTDGGITGYGEASLESREHAIEGAVKDLARQIVGQDPLRILYHLRAMTKHTHWEGGPVTSSAAGGIEMALWDIFGKSVEKPLWQLLGGRVRERIPVYSNGWFFGAKDASTFAERAAATVAAGFRGLKFAPFGATDFSIFEAGLSKAEAIVSAVREAAGSDVTLMIDGHGRFSTQSAQRVAAMLSKYDISFFEEPLHPSNLNGLQRLIATSPVPIAAGERCYDVASCMQLINAGVAVIQPDVIHLGGIYRTSIVGAMADASDVQISLHNSTGPIATAASLHLAATMPNLYLQEMFEPNDAPWKGAVVTPAVQIEDGFVSCPRGIGLGIEVDESEIARHPFKPQDLSLLRDSSVTGQAVAARND